MDRKKSETAHKVSKPDYDVDCPCVHQFCCFFPGVEEGCLSQLTKPELKIPVLLSLS